MPKFHAKRYLKLVEAVKNTPTRELSIHSFHRCPVGRYIQENPECGLQILQKYNPWTGIMSTGVFRTGEEWSDIENIQDPIIEQHFGITFDDVERIFYSEHYRNPNKRNILRKLNRFYQMKVTK